MDRSQRSVACLYFEGHSKNGEFSSGKFRPNPGAKDEFQRVSLGHKSIKLTQELKSHCVP